MFIIDENDKVIGHPDVQRLGLDVKGWVGTDANGYKFGPDMLSATGEGKWVSYVFRNPESGSLGSDHSGTLQLKNAWVVRHDGLLFASGWYINADEFTKSLVFAAVNKFRSAGLEATIVILHRPRERLFRTGSDYRLLQQRRDRRRGMVRVHSRQQRHNRRPLQQSTGGNGPQRRARHGYVRGHRRGQLGDHGGRARLGVRLRRAGVRLGLAWRSR